MYKEWYVFDLRSDGYTDIISEYLDTDIVDRLMSAPQSTFVGKYVTYEEAEQAASEYEDEIQREVDRSSGNYYDCDEDYVPLTQEDYDLDEDEEED